ncbi:PREDICTED: trypsin-like [Papilio polytes]|uniref:trypsin-like n=1 Tax=Papilio polytes TaxID=76194 RepID=UPI0006766E12|nr:PREDICTED: trypsin-like [Papilio polytes]
MFLQTKFKYFFALICFIKSSKALDWRVFGGQDLRYELHTSLVKLEVHALRETYCSGSIISNNWIISSAHCKEPGTVSITVLHGSRNGLTAIATVYNKDIIQHPNYIPKLTTPQNIGIDVALLRIRQSIIFGQNINAINLATYGASVGETGIIAGYGHTEPNLKAPREGPVVITHCPVFVSNVICTQGPVRAGHGDSGGPLILNGRMVGIIAGFGESEVYLTAPREGIVIIDSCPEKSSERTRNICTIGSVRAGSGDSGGPLIYKGKLAGLTSGGCVNVRKNNMCLTVYASVERNIGWISAIVSSV